MELAFEEHRYFDTRRWTPLSENMENEKFATGMKITKSGINLDYERFLLYSDGTTPSKYSYEKKWHFWPIPGADEIGRAHV